MYKLALDLVLSTVAVYVFQFAKSQKFLLRIFFAIYVLRL